MTDLAIEAPARARPESEGQSFWEIVRRSFFHRYLHRTAVAYVAVLGVIAVIVPLIVNGRPYTAVVDGTRKYPLFETLTRVDLLILLYAAAMAAYALWVWLARRQPDAESRRRVRFRGLCVIGLASLFLSDRILLKWFIDWMDLGEIVAAPVAVYAVARFLARRILHGKPSRAMRAWLIGFDTTMALAALYCLLACVGVSLTSEYNDLRHREDYKNLTGEYEVTHAVFPPLAWGFDDREYPSREASQFQSPSGAHWLGTDGSGRDTMARMLWGVRIVFGIGLISQVIAFAIGVTYGALMGYFGGRVDIYGSRFIEMVESVPTLFLIITFVALFGRQIFMIMVILGLVGWTGMARFVRAEFFKLRKADFVQAAIASGLPLRSVLFRHILPNCLTPVLVNVTFGIAGAVTSESGLSFLGLGVVPPTPSWGAILEEAGRPGSIFHVVLAMAPGVMIFLTIFAYNIIGEGLRDAIDPKLNKME